MRSTLSVTPAPFRSSHLAIPPSPFTPQIPISPPTTRPQTKPVLPRIPLTVPPPPQEPLKWLWQCHCCARIYHLGTTRRCLDDGHYFCAGAPVTKRDRKTGLKVTRKSRACASEFDYQGWKTWGTWRRDVEMQRSAAEALAAFDVAIESDDDLRLEDVTSVLPKPLFAPSVPGEGQWLNGAWVKKAAAAATGVSSSFWDKDCWGTCDYPSECRWGKQFGAQQTQTQAQAQVSVAALPSVPATAPPPPSSMVSESAAKHLEQPSSSFEKLSSSLPETIRELPEAEGDASCDHRHEDSSTTTTMVQEITKKPTFDDLLESAKRRKRRSAGPMPSPLASNAPSPTTASDEQEDSSQAAASAHSLQKAFDDFELDLKKSIGRASLLINGFVLGLKGNGVSEEEKAEAFVKGIHRTDRKKRREEREEDGQSLSD